MPDASRLSLAELLDELRQLREPMSDEWWIAWRKSMAYNALMLAWGEIDELVWHVSKHAERVFMLPTTRRWRLERWREAKEARTWLENVQQTLQGADSLTDEELGMIMRLLASQRSESW